LKLHGEDTHAGEEGEGDEHPEQAGVLKRIDFVTAISDQWKHQQLGQPWATPAVENPRLVRPRGQLEEAELIPVARGLMGGRYAQGDE
jgi:hypothetical protein